MLVVLLSGFWSARLFFVFFFGFTEMASTWDSTCVFQVLKNPSAVLNEEVVIKTRKRNHVATTWPLVFSLRKLSRNLGHAPWNGFDSRKLLGTTCFVQFSCYQKGFLGAPFYFEPRPLTAMNLEGFVQEEKHAEERDLCEYVVSWGLLCVCCCFSLFFFSCFCSPPSSFSSPSSLFLLFFCSLPSY